MTTTHSATQSDMLRFGRPHGDRMFGDRAQLRRAPRRILTVAPQGPVDRHGALWHEGDLAAQLALSMRNVENVLAGVGLDLTDVLRLTVHTTDVENVLAAPAAITEALELVGATPPITVIGVTRLPVTGMAVQIEITAGR